MEISIQGILMTIPICGSYEAILDGLVLDKFTSD